ncbi:hypothetical protein E2C01_101450 [Portunus trituberculatus]|uniref:Uncharacterized protein n=1 Tax=Portunus trituberculatus TaxID=210409 RepID=A0A5B7K5R1_PORTR|nr:hypothetical protein [Portunus trituberculatus]
MEHEDVFSRDAQDLGCMSLVHPSNTTDSPSMKQPHGSVSLAKRRDEAASEPGHWTTT